MKLYFHHSTRDKNNGYLLAGSVLLIISLIIFGIPVFQEIETPFSKILLVGGIPFLLGLGLVSTYSGTLIDFEKKKLKKYMSIFWIKTGLWESLPQVENAELIHYTYQQKNLPNGISPTISSEITTFKCVLKLEGKKLLVFDYANEKNAIKALAQIQEGLCL